MADTAASSGSYTPKNILLTGGAGFIASHVVLQLVKNFPEYRVINLDKLDYCSSLKNLAEIESYPNYKFVKGDIASPDLVMYLMKSENIDTVMHFAAQTHVDNSFGNSITFTRNNILGTHVLLESAKVCGIKRFIHVSTDEVYGEIEHGNPSATEGSHLEPTNPYAATKAGAEYLVKAYHRSHNLPVIITRGNNVYGPHQYPEKLIPKLTCRLLRGMSCCIHGKGTSRRMFLYVTDTADAFVKILHEGKIGEIYNIGCDAEFSTLEVAKKLITLLGLESRMDELLEFVEDRAFNDCRYAIDSSKLHALGWKPKVSWEEGLRTTIEWYKQYAGNWEGFENALVPHPKAPTTTF